MPLTTYHMAGTEYITTRRSREDCWPLRGADGKTFAERKVEQENNDAV